jgi:serine protease Do
MMNGHRPSELFRLLSLAVIITAMWAVASGIVGSAPAHAQDDVPEQVWIEESDHEGIDPEAPLRFSSLSTLAERLSPSVVNIIVSYGSGDDIERLLGKGEWSVTPHAAAQGTGFVIHPDGYILTNNHVVEGAGAITVKMLDSAEHDARIVGMDPQTDVALLKIDTKRKLPAIALGDSEKTRVGEHVIAIGNPMGLSHTVTTGIVSALGRRDLGIDNDVYAEFIQTDASINPGNSGGPLIGLGGDVIGMNTAINRHGQGIGFAIPINMVKKLLPHLAEKGYVVRSWLGVRVQSLDRQLAKTFGLDKPTGALVTEVVDESPATKGGIKAGDVILSFDGTAISSSDRLPWLASTAGAGRTVNVEVLRKKKRIDLDVHLEKLPDQDPPSIPKLTQSKAAAPSGADFGVNVKELTDSLARQLGASDANGVVVTTVGDDSAARGAGLRQRDVITEVGDARVKDSSEFDKALAGFGSGEVVRLKVVRGGRVVYIAVQK